MRFLKKAEIDLISDLLNNNRNFNDFVDNLNKIKVEEMNDGGMGSLKFILNDNRKGIFKDEIASINIRDVDGVPVRFTLNINTEGQIYELDVFKGDFSPLKQFPIPPYNPLQPSQEL